MKEVIIDAHVHMGKGYGIGGEKREADADYLIHLADRVGIDKLFVTNTFECWYDMHRGNEEVAEAMRRYPDRIIGYITIPSSRFREEAMEEIEIRAKRDGFRGLKMLSRYIQIPQPGIRFSVNEPWTYPILEKAADLNLLVLLHCTPEECEGLAEAVSDARLLMAHMGGTQMAYGNWNRAIMVAEKYDNIYLDTTSSCIDMGMIETAVERIGAERVIYGSDIPLLNPYVQLEKVRSAEISEKDKDLILGGNIARILDLEM